MSYEAFSMNIHLSTSSEPEASDDEAVLGGLATARTPATKRSSGPLRLARVAPGAARKPV